MGNNESTIKFIGGTVLVDGIKVGTYAPAKGGTVVLIDGFLPTFYQLHATAKADLRDHFSGY